MSRTYTKEDVSFHSDGYRPSNPAVNVKVYDTLEDGFRKFAEWEDVDDGFTVEWIRANISDAALDDWFYDVCRDEFDYLESWTTGNDGDPLFPGHSVTLEQEGRSGGWVAVHGLPDLEDWDAVLLARWRKFERIARSIADEIMAHVVESIYINAWEWWKQEAAERERAATQGIATKEA